MLTRAGAESDSGTTTAGTPVMRYGWPVLTFPLVEQDSVVSSFTEHPQPPRAELLISVWIISVGATADSVDEVSSGLFKINSCKN